MGTPQIPSVDSDSKQFPTAVRQRIAANLSDGSTTEGAAVAAAAAVATSGKAPIASPSFTGVPTVNGQQLAPAATPYPYWRKKLAQVRAGTSDAKLLCLGDSTTLGYVAPPNNVATPALASYPSDLAAQLNSYFASSFVGLGIPQGVGTVTDGRWTLGTGWATSPGDGVGWTNSQMYKATASSGALVYAPGGQSGSVDRFDVYYIATGNTAPFTVQATGGAATTVTPGTQDGVFKTTCSAGSASTANSVSISSGTSSLRIVGVEPWNSTATRVRVGNAGVGGSGTQTWATSSGPNYASLACITAYAPDLSIIDLGLNDMASPNTDPAVFTSRMTTIINTCRLSGDVILMVPPPPSIGGSSNLTAGYAALIPTYAPLAVTNATGLVDITSRWGSYTALNPLGYYSDTLHPSRIGYGDIAQAVTTLVRAI